MQAKDFIKRQDTPKKRIMTQAKEHAKARLGIQAGEQDVTTQDFFNAMCEYLEQLEAALLHVQTKLVKIEEDVTTK